ncbi:hypothetical protein IKS57_06200 [bacterium]|nr:hypothetical protein [bacterium]
MGLIPNATNSTYAVNINQYNETYQYVVVETINNISYTSAPITLTPNLKNFTATASINNKNAVNGQINFESASAPQRFYLSINCYGENFDA